MGWEDVKVAADYEGEHHWSKRLQIDHDIKRFDEVTELGWIDIRVTERDTEAVIIGRVGAARARRL